MWFFYLIYLIEEKPFWEDNLKLRVEAAGFRRFTREHFSEKKEVMHLQQKQPKKSCWYKKKKNSKGKIFSKKKNWIHNTETVKQKASVIVMCQKWKKRPQLQWKDSGFNYDAQFIMLALAKCFHVVCIFKCLLQTASFIDYSKLQTWNEAKTLSGS